MTAQEKIAENKKYICDSYLMLHNIDYETLDNWECPICFRNIYDKNDAIFFPFICDHITCYSCFNAHCKYLRNTQKINDLTNYMKCSLCRSRVNKEWKKAKIEFLPMQPGDVSESFAEISKSKKNPDRIVV